MTADNQVGTGSASSSAAFNNNSEISSNSGSGPDNGTYNYAASNDPGQLNSISNGGSTTQSFTYNGDGDRTSCTDSSGNNVCAYASSATYQYDAAERLTQVAAGGTENMSYDGDSELTQETQTEQGSCPSVVQGLAPADQQLPRRDVGTPSGSGYTYYEHFTWSTASGSPSLAVTSETNDCNNFGHTDYLMGLDEQPVEQVEVDSTGSIQTPEYYYQDFQGNTRALLDQSGNAVDVYNYPAWGAASNWVGLSGIGTPLQYAGAVSDSWNGLVYDQARWYDPSTGQFVSQDPMVDDTLQPYAYADGNPVNAGDPTGLVCAPRKHCQESWGPNPDKTGSWKLTFTRVWEEMTKPGTPQKFYKALRYSAKITPGKHPQFGVLLGHLIIHAVVDGTSLHGQGVYGVLDKTWEHPKPGRTYTFMPPWHQKWVLEVGIDLDYGKAKVRLHRADHHWLVYSDGLGYAGGSGTDR